MNKNKRKYGFKYRLDIANYTNNAANNLSLTKIVTFTCVSLVLSIMLFISIIENDYTGKALLFTGVVFILIVCFTVLNIIALIKKISNK